jgi:GT2 family glycosyltransferase
MSASSHPLISLVTVTYQSAAEVQGALDSARTAAAAAGHPLELIVVDNASTDGSADVAASAAPDATVVRNTDNRGFGVASNQAFELARGELLLLLNPDARLEPAALGTLVAWLAAEPGAALAAPSIVGPGTVESAGMAPGIRSFAGHYLLVNRILPGGGRGPWRGFALPRQRGPQPVEVDWASAAAVLLRTEAVRAVGGFDPTIFLYGEDIELCGRLRRAGWTLWLVPAARAHHRIGGSQAVVSTRWVDGLHRLYARRSGRLRLATFDTILALGLAARAIRARVRTTRGDRDHVRRMGAGARRAARLAGIALAGRAISADQPPTSPPSQAS